MNFDYSWTALFRPDKATKYFFNPGKKGRFQTDAPGYSLVNAWWLSEISRLIYRPGKDEITNQPDFITRNKILEIAGFQEYRFFKNGSTACAVILGNKVSDKPFAVLVFRGSLEAGNWVTNLNAFQSEWRRGGYVHSGFKNAFYSVWHDVRETLLSLKMPVFYTGHSLGAALAVLAASEMPPRAAYTFGAPRIGDFDFVYSMRRRNIYRIVNHQDIVPNVPPSGILYDFFHVGEPHYLKSRKHISSDISSTESLRRFIGTPEYLADHAPVNYTASLERMIA